MRQPSKLKTMSPHQPKPAVAQLKAGVTGQGATRLKPTLKSAPSVKPPVPPARPLPATKTLQPKIATAASSRRPPTAPPVFRPQQTPRVLQTKSSPVVQRHVVGSQSPPVLQPKSVLAPRRPPAPPPAYRPQPTPKVLQTKKAVGATRPVSSHHIASGIQLRPAPQTQAGIKTNTIQAAGLRSRTAQPKASTIQLANDKLVRHPFSAKVRSTLKVNYGEHRRHIIPNHLMKNMLQSWWDCHEDDKHGAQTSIPDLQNLLDTMNNYMPNLVPGEGRANTAIGMLSTNIGKQLPHLEEDGATPMEISASLSHYGGFQQAKQQELMAPVLKAYKKDPEISASHEEAFEMAEDIQFSTDFDWPGGDYSPYFEVWFSMYETFREIEAQPENYTYLKLQGAIKAFMKLPSP